MRTVVLGGVLLLSACLVTDRVDYDRPNTPAQLRKREPTDFGRVPPVADDGCSTTGGSGDNQPWLRLRVEVSDLDVEDELDARVVINGVFVHDEKVGGLGSVQRDDFEYCIPLGRLNDACLHIEVLVSRDFVRTDMPYETTDARDLASVEWWLLGPSDNFSEVGPTECNDAAKEGR